MLYLLYLLYLGVVITKMMVNCFRVKVFEKGVKNCLETIDNI